jgi:hypothetical protein
MITRAYVDTASLHTALNEVCQGKNGSLSKWHRHSLLEVTFLLLQYNMRLIPRIGRNKNKISGETADVATFAKALSDVPFPRARTRDINRRLALQLTLDWLETNYLSLKPAWQAAKNNKDLRDWLEVQREFRIIQHTQIHGQLFEEIFISRMSDLLDVSPTQLDDIYNISTNVDSVKKLLQNTSEPALELLTLAWLLGGMIRGKYYEILSELEGTQIALHPFRAPFEKPLDITHSWSINPAQQIFVNLIIGSALEQSPQYRVAALAYNINLARKFLFAKDRDVRIDLQNLGNPDKSEKAAFEAARKIGIMGGTPRKRKILQYVSGSAYPTLVGACLSQFPGIDATTVAIGTGLFKAVDTANSIIRGKRSLGQLTTEYIATSNLEFRRLAELGAGRVKTKILPKRGSE